MLKIYALKNTIRQNKPFFKFLIKFFLFYIVFTFLYKAFLFQYDVEKNEIDFFTNQVITPLWQQGYRGFFLDTLDSYQLVAKTPEARARQEAGLIAAIFIAYMFFH